MNKIVFLFFFASIALIGVLQATNADKELVISDQIASADIKNDIATCTSNYQATNFSFSTYFSGIFSTENWPARWTCGNWSQTEGWLYISSDLSIFLAYLSIPIMLLWFIRKIELGKLKWLVILFGSFILLCGFTHLIDVVLFWEPMYRLSGFAKLLTGIVSLATATVLGFVIPKALEYKSPEVLQAEIDERKKIQNQFELFVKFSPGAIAMLDTEMRYIMANDGWYKDYGIEGADIIGKSHYEIFPQILKMPEWIELHRRALAGEKLSKDFDALQNDNSVTYLRWKLEPWYEAEGKIGGIIMFTEVITNEIITQNKLKESERRFTNIFNKAQFAIALVGDGGVPFLVNNQFCKLLGYSEVELTSMSFEKFTHSDDVAKDVSRYQKLLNYEIDSYTIDKRYITKSGEIKYVKLNVTLVDEGTDKEYALALVEDITEAELAQMKKRQSEEKMIELNKLFEDVSKMAKIGAWEIDVETQECYWSDVVYQIHEENPSKKILVDEGINYFHSDDRATLENAVKNAIDNNQSYDLELRLVTAKGREVWTRAIGKPVFEESKLVKLQGLFQDIDLKKKYELEINQSRKQLEDIVNQRTLDLKTANGELEAFSYSVSHDLRAPLRAINGYSEALLEDYNEGLEEEASQYLIRIAANSRKMGELIDDLLEFSRMNRKRVSFAEVDIYSLFHRLISELFTDSANNITVNQLPTIWCDQEMVAQVLTNLLSNAIKYSSKESNPEIVVSSKEEEEEDAIVLSIKDNGVGFNMAYYDKLFQVFQRLHTEKEFEGTGVGLSLCSKIMSAHDGEIWAESKESEGATFFLRFKKTKEV